MYEAIIKRDHESYCNWLPNSAITLQLIGPISPQMSLWSMWLLYKPRYLYISFVYLTVVPKEYCESQTFKAKCWRNEVIMMQTALYGRMRIGGCVSNDLGYIGCNADVLDLLDKRCSGQQECEIRVPNEELDMTHPCYKELKVYLETSYTCVRGRNLKHTHHTIRHMLVLVISNVQPPCRCVLNRKNISPCD